MAFRKETIVFLLLVVISLLLFLVSGNGLIGVILLGLFLYGILALITIYITGRHVDFHIKSSVDGETNITVKNNSIIPIVNLVIEIGVKNLLNGEVIKQVVSESVGPRKEKNIFFNIKTKYSGTMYISMNRVYLMDPLSILKREVSRKAFDHVYEKHTIFPKYRKVELSPEELQFYDMESYRFAENMIGSDPSETVGIREYEIGDDIRRIHWKLTAKAEGIMVKELGLPVDNRIIILADKGINEGNFDEIEHMSETTLSLSYTFLDKGLPHLVVWEESAENGAIGELRHYMVSNEDEFFVMGSQFLSSPHFKNSIGPIKPLIASNIVSEGSVFILVGDEEGIDSEDLDRLMEFGNVSFYTSEK